MEAPAMSAADALRAAHAAGILVTLDGDGLMLEAAVEPPRSILDALARHKRTANQPEYRLLDGRG
jgi:hypothetical protein